MEKKEIKVKIDTRLYEKAIEYGIDLEKALDTGLLTQLDEINHRIEQEKLFKQVKEHDDYWKVLKIIRKMSKKSKFKYASESNIIAEAQLESIRREETIKILKELMERKEIYQPIKSNYKVTKVKTKN
jgi:DNA replicative helicase MCM subunit Mcm2 (Cdc46/Mcm family)